MTHMWGKLNIPIFLFNVGLLTLIKIDSLNFWLNPVYLIVANFYMEYFEQKALSTAPLQALAQVCG